MQKILNGQALTLGTCYYPEHWDESLWEEDLKRMLAVGIRTVRVAEFAWSKTEPEEGVFVYDFWERFLDLSEKCGMQVIFCTPTATAPAWLTEKYPEVLNCDIKGVPYYHGERQQTNYNSPVYQRFSERITEKLAAHFGKHPAIIGWQLDNEFNCGINVFYSEADTEAFRVFLEKKYGSVEALNAAWGTAFWNQTYNSFSEIHVPRNTINQSRNPHLELDYRRFVSDSCCRFAKAQADIIRKYKKPDDFITTNGIFGNLDYDRLMAESLDEITYDSYPDFAFALDDYQPEGLLDRKWSRNLALVRAIKPVFGIMEQQSGANGWNTRMEAPTPRPGQLSLWTMQSVAHGADYVSYFRWRTCRFGTEMYWHGILDYSGRDNRRLSEVGEVNRAFEKLSCVAGSRVKASVGILMDYDNEFDLDIDAWHRRIDGFSKKSLFNALQKMHAPFDFVHLSDETAVDKLLPYDVLFYPHPEITDEARVRTLRAFVEQGGTLILGARSGQKDMNGVSTDRLLPGLFRELSGADVLEYSFVAPDEAPAMTRIFDTEAEAGVFNEVLEALPGAEVLARYENTYIQGAASLVRNRVGKGAVYYFGAAFSEEAVRAFAKELGFYEPYGAVISVPESMELSLREKDGKRFFFVLNYPKAEGEIDLHGSFKNLLTNEVLTGSVKLPAYGYLVLEEI